MTRNKAFTLSELLIALAIVGTIAALSIPALVEDINRRVTANQLKNTVIAIQNVIDNQLAENKTKSLKETDFSDPAKLLSSDNFTIADNCSTSSNCWANNSHYPYVYRRLSDMAYVQAVPENTTIKLKNGVTLSYQIMVGENSINDGSKENDSCYGLFFLDINGKDKPNIVGRDFFAFRVTRKGKIIYNTTCNGVDNSTDTQMETWCTNNSYPTACLAHIQRNNWKIKY